MVWRIVWYCLLLALVVIGSVWLADHPGDVSIRWLSWRFDTNVPQMLVLLLLVLFVLYVVGRFLRSILSIPRRWKEYRLRRRQLKGIRALTGSLTALAAQDEKKALSYARRTDNLLADQALSLLLTTQAAELTGDGDTVRKNYKEMLKQPETEFVALRGLLMQALKDQDDALALGYAERALSMNASAVWLLPILLDLYMRSRQWEQAMKILIRLGRFSLLAPQEISRKKAFVLNEQAALQEAESPGQALRLARQSYEADASFMPALVRMTRLSIALGKESKAASMLEEAWSRDPNAEIAHLYASLFEKKEALEQVPHAEKLVKMRPESPDGHALLGEISLRARLWGQARKHLLLAYEAAPILRHCMLMVRLEDAEGNADGVRDWLDKAMLLTAAA